MVEQSVEDSTMSVTATGVQLRRECPKLLYRHRGTLPDGDLIGASQMQHPRRHMKKLTTAFGAPVDDNQNIATAGERGPALLQNIWFLEKLAHFER
jgi:hypothetical protein